MQLAHAIPPDDPVAAASLVALSYTHDDAAGIVRVRRGNVWLTEEGDSRDHFLGAGQEFRITRRGTALISALEASVLSLASSRAARLAERIGLVRAGTDIVEPLALSS